MPWERLKMFEEEGEMRLKDNPMKLVNGLFPNLLGFMEHLLIYKKNLAAPFDGHKGQIIFIDWRQPWHQLNQVCCGTPVGNH